MRKNFPATLFSAACLLAAAACAKPQLPIHTAVQLRKAGTTAQDSAKSAEEAAREANNALEQARKELQRR